MVVQVAQIVQVVQAVQVVKPVKLVQLVIIVINALIVKLVIHNVIQTINNYLNPSHVYPLPAWQLPPLVNILHQLYTSLQS